MYTEQLSILRDNLALFCERGEISTEQKALTLRSIASLICNNEAIESVRDVYDAYNESIYEQSAQSEYFIFRELLSSARLMPEIQDILAICDDAPADVKGNVAYVKNRFCDIAYERLCTDINSAYALLVGSPQEACELVLSGNSEFCILPIENARDGKLFGFYSMLDRFGLKICRICTIDTDEEYSYVKYALISRSCKDVLDTARVDEQYIFEFSVLSENAAFVADTVNFAALCGAIPLTIDSRPSPYDPNLQKYLFSFLLDGSFDFLLYPALKLTGYTPIGFFKHEQNKNK